MLSSLKSENISYRPKVSSRRWPDRLPAEVWTDSFKMLSRRDLVCRVQPVCAQFHVICEQNVPSVHVVTRFDQFLNNLADNLPAAKQQYDNLAANRTDLARHFRIGGRVSYTLAPDLANPARSKRFQRAQMCLLKHSLDLFVGCRLIIYFSKLQPDTQKEVFAYLNLLHTVNPAQITLAIKSVLSEPTKFWHIDEMLYHSTVCDCSRLTTRGSDKSSEQKMKPSAAAVSNWLHFLPFGQRPGISARFFVVDPMLPSSFDELVEQCKKQFSEAQSPTSDCRSFVVHAKTNVVADWPHNSSWQIANERTGEVLLFERVIINDQVPFHHLRLRRCQADALKDEKKFYGENFQNFLLLKDLQAEGRNACPLLTLE